VIDTPGAELSARAEEDGLASEIAHCLADLTTLPVPTVSLLLGQGAGAAALALLPADRVLTAQYAWLAPLASEGASAIVYRGTGHAPQLAARQGIGSTDLAADGVVDEVIPETPADPGRFCRDLGHALHRALEAWHARATTHAWPGACTATAASGSTPSAPLPAPPLTGCPGRERPSSASANAPTSSPPSAGPGNSFATAPPSS
jgi:hypothetical protein